MPTGVHDTSLHQPDCDHVVIAIISEPLINRLISSDAKELHDGEDINATIRAIDLNKEEDLNVFVGEANWDDHVSKLEQSLSSGNVSAAYMIHPGTTMNSTCRSSHEPYGRKRLAHDMIKKSRVDTCLALRFLQLIGIYTAYSIPWLLITPQVAGNEFDITELPDYDEVRRNFMCITQDRGQGLKVQLLSSASVSLETNIVRHIIGLMLLCPRAQGSRSDYLKKKLKMARDLMLVDDGLRPHVKRLLALRGEGAHDHRIVENNEALGGCATPPRP